MHLTSPGRSRDVRHSERLKELSQVCSSIDIMAAADGYACLSAADRKGMHVIGMSGDEPAGCRSAAAGCPVLL